MRRTLVDTEGRLILLVNVRRTKNWRDGVNCNKCRGDFVRGNERKNGGKWKDSTKESEESNR